MALPKVIFVREEVEDKEHYLIADRDPFLVAGDIASHEVVTIGVYSLLEIKLFKKVVKEI
mgnify:CR=1 FL=1